MATRIKNPEFRSINVPLPIHRKLRMLSAIKDRRIGEYVTQVLTDHLDRQSKGNPALMN